MPTCSSRPRSDTFNINVPLPRYGYSRTQPEPPDFARMAKKLDSTLRLRPLQNENRIIIGVLEFKCNSSPGFFARRLRQFDVL